MTTPATTAPVPPAILDVLQRALTEPGVIHAAFTAFHGYSLGNQMLAWFQCDVRGIPMGPIATFNGWRDKGRMVTRGSKAIALCMPITAKRRAEAVEGEAADEAGGGTYTRFVYRNHWFVLAQTEGAAYVAPALPTWDAARALAALNITEVPFAMVDGNTQGYATRAREIAVSPVAALPLATRFHELAHVVLGHTAEGDLTDDARTTRSMREVEAESVALLCLDALQLDGAEYCRGYIQHWLAQGGEVFTERHAQRIFKAADQILKAGRPADGAEEAA